VLALISLGPTRRQSSLEVFGWDAMARVHEKGYISYPHRQSESTTFSAQGLTESERL